VAGDGNGVNELLRHCSTLLKKGSEINFIQEITGLSKEDIKLHDKKYKKGCEGRQNKLK
jgi:hypothetical protein